MLSVLFFFFFKQKTAYEMRISDWSSDVCSSDLGRRRGGNGRGASGRSCERRGGGRNAPPSPARDQSWAISAMVTAISKIDGPDVALSLISDPNSPTTVSSNGSAAMSTGGSSIFPSCPDRRRDRPPQTGLGGRAAVAEVKIGSA